MSPTPASLGFLLPAEWEEHKATWMAWPHNRSDWPGKLSSVRWAYGEMIRKIVPGERVFLLVRSPAEERQARSLLARVGVDLLQVRFFHFPTNRSWTRDFSPFFVRRPKEVAAVRFRFNAWARYREWELDDGVSEKMARALGLRLFSARWKGREVVLEGGSVEGNGQGVLLSTEECLLDQRVQVRNPGLGRKDLEGIFSAYLGAKEVFWLGRGLAGDDTHGHIDGVCRFVGPHTVVLCQEEDPKDANYLPLRENRERLEGVRLWDGSRLEVIPRPHPAPR